MLIATAMNDYQELLSSYVTQNSELQYEVHTGLLTVHHNLIHENDQTLLPLYQFTCVSFAGRVYIYRLCACRTSGTGVGRRMLTTDDVAWQLVIDVLPH